MRRKHNCVLASDASTGSGNYCDTTLDEISHDQLLAVRGDWTAVKCTVCNGYARNRTQNYPMTGSPPSNEPGNRPRVSAGPSGPTNTPESHATSPSLLFVEIFLAAILFFALLVSPILGALIDLFADSDDPSVSEVAQTSVFAIFILTLGFQVIQGCFPWVHSRRRGFTIAQDWHFRTELPGDLAAGAVMAIGCFGGAQLATRATAWLVRLKDTDDASNADILVDNKGSLWIIGVILLVVIGAPLAEELLFRGFLLRTLQRRFGSIFAIVVSSLLFTIPHWQADASWQETVVLLSALGVVGLVLAIGAVVTDRLGPPMIAHFLFNATGTLIALFA
jgi:membrane protease YdiL (CAAX protease family)